MSKDGSRPSASASSRRGALAFGALVIVLLAAITAWRMWPRDDEESADQPLEAVAPGAEEEDEARSAHRAIGDASIAAAPVASADPTPSAPAAYDDPSDGLDLPPPPLTTEPPRERPERPADRPEYIVGQREAGVALLDRTIERLTREADERERAGDAEGARRLRLRVERTRAVRAQRAEELEILRAGGTLPDDEPERR